MFALVPVADGSLNGRPFFVILTSSVTSNLPAVAAGTLVMAAPSPVKSSIEILNWLLVFASR